MVQEVSQLVDMTDVIGNLALDYNLPYMSLENLVELGKHTKRVYKLDDSAKTISVEQFFEYIAKFVQTPFGNKVYRSLSAK